jgi:DNA repair protein RadC
MEGRTARLALEDHAMQLGLFTHDPGPSGRYGRVPVYRVTLVKESAVQTERPQFRRSADVSTLLQTILAGADREHFVVILLDRKNRLIGINTASIGSLSASVVHPREVFKPAILSNAAAIVCAHNHPSGDPQPSQEDRVLTARLVEAGKVLGIQVLDHIIVGEGRYLSFADEGLLS